MTQMIVGHDTAETTSHAGSASYTDEGQSAGPRTLAEIRAKHGFTGGNTQDWSKNQLCSGAAQYPQVNDPDHAVEGQIETIDGGSVFPKNAPLLNALKTRFALFGFDWKAQVIDQTVRGGATKQRQNVQYTNYPSIGGVSPTLLDLLILPLEMFDGYADRVALMGVNVGEPASKGFDAQIARQNATGIGYKGFEGVSWHTMEAPFVLPLALEQQLQDLADSLFAFFDAVTAVYPEDKGLQALLNHKRPKHIPGMTTDEPMLFIRPDIVLQEDPDSPSGYTPVITELESCPAGHGMMHAMNEGFKIDDDMVDQFVEFLDGRPYVVVATSEWSEYLWDQGSFIAALRARGVEAYIVFDEPLAEIHKDVQTRWALPKGAPRHMREQWSTDFLGRIERLGWTDFVLGMEDISGFDFVDGTVLFRFGYFDNFSSENLEYMQGLVRDASCTVVNPVNFYLESKSLMAAVGNEQVRNWLNEHHPGAVEILDRCIARTRVVDHAFCDINALYGDDEQEPLCRMFALTKYASWDGNNESWGSRSLEVGSQLTKGQWKANVDACLAKDHPVVAQHVIKSSTHQVVYVDGNGCLQVLSGARTRLTPFFLRHGEGEGADMLGHMLTLRASTLRIHGATDSVEVPVVFEDLD